MVPRKTGHQAAALDLLIADLRAFLDAADALLSSSAVRMPMKQVVLAPDVFDDRLVKRRARRFDGFRLHHAVERYDRRFRCAAADIDDHMAVRAVHVQTRADRRGDRRGDKIHFSSARLDDGVHNGALLHAGDAARHAHEHARAEEAEARHAADEFRAAFRRSCRNRR